MEADKLKKDSLNLLETIALSVAIMGPSASIAITVGMMGNFVNYSEPLVFFISMIIIGFVAVSIVKLNQYFPSSGSVYFFAQKTLGKRAGFVTGWLIILAYLMLGASCSAVATSYYQNLLSIFDVHIHWKIISIILMLVIGYLAHKDAKTSSGVMLIIEIISMGLILVLAFIIVIGASKTTGLSIEPFKLGENSFSSIGYAAVFGFLAFSGFEGASVLGEESKNPKKTIPIAIFCSVLITGFLYIFVSYAQVLGFGISPEGIKAFTSSETPLGELISKYLSSKFSILIMLCVGISFFSTTLGCVNAGARVLFTMSRDCMLSQALSKTHKKYNTPYIGLNIFISIITIVLMANVGLEAIHLGGYVAMTGTLALLLSYIITTAGAIAFFHKNKLWRNFQLIIPILSIIALAFIFFANIYPVRAFPMNMFSYIVLVWLIIGVLISKRKTAFSGLQ
ncbi:MAG TPA: APC family permease [Mobilitalea sp.]|nr:APC family permease [Mobilitalea sp.]